MILLVTSVAVPEWNLLLVALSVFIATFASYTALDLASRVATAAGSTKKVWLVGGSLAMGIGIWSMHFVGMLAMTLPVPIAYDVPLWLLSVLIAIAASLLALLIIGKREISPAQHLAGGILLAVAISGMHYTGMAAMRIPGSMTYDPLLVTASIVIAFVASFAALWLAVRFRDDSESFGFWKLAAAIVMGFAISGMHYTGMAAVTYRVDLSAVTIRNRELLATNSLAVAVIIGSLAILVISLSGVAVDRSLRRKRDRERREKWQLALLLRLVDGLPLGIVATDAGGSLIYLNTIAKELIGNENQPVTSIAMMSDMLELRVRGKGSDRLRLHELLSGRSSGVLEIAARPGHPERVVRCSGVPVRDDDGHLLYMMAILEEITEKEAMEQEVVRRKELLSVAQEIAKLGSWEWNIRTGEVSWSDEVYRIFGVEPDRFEPSFESFLSLVDEEDRQLVEESVTIAVSEGSKYVSSFRFIHSDGRKRIAVALGKVTTDASGNPLSLVGTLQDVTEEHLLESELRASETRLKEAQELAQIGSWEWDVATGELKWSENLYRILGVSQELSPDFEFFLSLVHPDDRGVLHERLADALGGGSDMSQDMRIIRPDGSVVVIHSRGKALFSDQGEPIRMVGSAQDVTTRRQMESELRTAKDAAEDANRAKSEFLANMSHEIRTPLNGIIGMTELTLATDLAPEQREYLEMSRSSAEALIDLVGDILDFSRIEARKLELSRGPFSLREILGTTMHGLSLQAAERGLELVLRIDPDLPDGMVGDASRLRQIVVNLVSNAIKFTDEGEVVVRVGEKGSSDGNVVVEFSVSDTGIGIPRDLQQKIFESFSQADTSATRRFGGTGLGLTISSQLVQLMGGSIEVESEPGKGSTFRFTVRLEREPSADYDVSRAVEELEGLRVLVADDNETNRRVLEEILLSWRMEPLLVPSAKEALQVIEDRGDDFFALVLTDAHMPDIDGFSLAEQIGSRTSSRRPVILMLSSGARPDYVQRSRDAGIKYLLTKPVKQSDLLDAIMAAVVGPSGSIHEEPLRAETTLPHARSLRVLVTEDNRVNQHLAMRLLERLGHEPEIASDGREAVDLVATKQFDLVMMDVQMPRMDGFEATRLIREREDDRRHLPIIAVTAHAIAGDRERCLEAGMDDYVSKPLRERTLQEVIDRVAERFYGQAERRDQTESNGAGEPKGRSGPLDQYRDDRELLQQLAGLIIEDSEKLIAELRNAALEEDADRIEKTAHSLKGDLLLLGEDPTIELAARIETVARDGDLAEIAELVGELDSELVRLRAELREIMEAPGAQSAS